MTDPETTATDVDERELWTFTPSASTAEEGDALALRVLRVFAFDQCRDVMWREDNGILSMHVNCSDVFHWGTADAEEITADNIDLLEATFAECGEKFGRYETDYAGDLFAARLRGMRPQGAYYAHVPDEWADLFNACGPERETGLGNPLTPEQARQRAADRAASISGRPVTES